MKNLFLIVLIFGGITLSAQVIDLGTSTYAVVVGISDYQDEDIPDLRFADRDAEAFANYLRSPAGGSLDGDHLKLLTNSEATLGQFAAALDWLMEVTKEGDNAIVYFSGHGDVEKKTITQPGYLLCWDAPSRVYMGGGAFALNMLQEVVSTLSIQNKAKVVVITDACRSGTLAGQSVGGAQSTAANLAKQYANEIKILSCQPNEYSIEGEQWGGGRGAFSFNLVDALYGLADGNNDLFVTLQEVGRYLEDHVTAEVAPVSQVPMVIGNRTERLASVDAKLLAELRSGRTSQMKMLFPVEMRGMEDDVLAAVDTTVREMYRLFKKALKDKVFLEPTGACADAYYERLMAEPKMQRLHSTMTRNFAAALQDDAQQSLNFWLQYGGTPTNTRSENVINHLPIKFIKERTKAYPRYLQRAAELLGTHHYMYAALQARRLFFEGYILAGNRSNADDALELFRKSLQWQAEQPHVYWQISSLYAFHLKQLDSSEYYAHRAVELLPNWSLPYLDLAFYFAENSRQFDRAKYYLEQITLIDSSSSVVHNYWGVYFANQNMVAEAERHYLKSIQLDSTILNAPGFQNLATLYKDNNQFEMAEPLFKKAVQLDSTYSLAQNNLAALYVLMGKWPEAEKHYDKAIELDSTYADAYFGKADLYFFTQRYADAEQQLLKTIKYDSAYITAYDNLGILYTMMKRYEESEQLFKKVIEYDSSLINVRINLGSLYVATKRFSEAEQEFLKALELNPANPLAHYGLATMYVYMRNMDKAFKALEMALKNGFTQYDYMQQDGDIALLREDTERWQALMQKYFPDQIKD